MGRLPYCEKQGWQIEGDSNNSVNAAMVGFAEWCPLETVETARKANNYKNEVNQILRIMEDDVNQDTLLEASLYLNKVVENAKKKTEVN
jgi:hypothetical protein